MKKIVLLIAMCLVGVFFIPMSASAYNQVPQMNIDVVLNNDGSANITQRWTTSSDDGTEYYFDILDSGYLSVTDFSVSDKSGKYKVIKDWNIDASFEEKANKCGVLDIDGGVELCFGISSYGENTYEISYVLNDLVGAYEDCDGFNFRFVNADLSFFPTNVDLYISTEQGVALKDNNADIWAFGYDGQIEFEKNKIHAYTEYEIEDSQNMTIMVALDKGVLEPSRQVNESFENVKEKAFEGSDYESDEFTMFDFFILGGIAFIIVVVIVYFIVGKVKKKKFIKDAGYFREVPNDGNINTSYVLGQIYGFCKEENFIGARMLNLLMQGCLEPINDVGQKEVSMQLIHAPQSGDTYDEKLFEMLANAAGDDGILQPKEFQKYCNNLTVQQNLDNYYKNCKSNGIKNLKNKGCLKGSSCSSLGSFTTVGIKEFNDLIGLHNYLKDFSLIAEREVKETAIWEEYMIYASLFGIATEVAKEMKHLYPHQLEQIDRYEHYIYYSYGYNNYMYHAMRAEYARQQAARSAGSGGSASFGGGGGFSGGGGGGSR